MPVERHLLLMRHAKSDWGDSSLSDHDRPLNDRGLRDAPEMGRLLEREKLTPDRIVSSTARRTQHTAQIVAANCGYAGEIETQGELYHGSPRDWAAAAARLAGETKIVLFVGHNPGMEQFQRDLSGQFETFPTATIAWLSFEGDWNKLPYGQMHLQTIWRPKEL